MAAVVVYSSLGLSAHRCEVCLRFEGRQACRTVEAATEEEARNGATTNVCALLTSGVTKSMQCQRATPERVSCQGIP